MSERTINRRKFLEIARAAGIGLGIAGATGIGFVFAGCGVEGNPKAGEMYPVPNINPDTVQALTRLTGLSPNMSRTEFGYFAANQYSIWGLDLGLVGRYVREYGGDKQDIMIDPRNGEQLFFGPRSNLRYPGQTVPTLRELRADRAVVTFYGPPEAVSRLAKQADAFFPFLADCFGDPLISQIGFVVNATPSGQPININSSDRDLVRLYGTPESQILSTNACTSMVPVEGGTGLTVVLNLNQIDRYAADLGLSPHRALLMVVANEVTNYLGYMAVAKGLAEKGNGKSEAPSTLAGILAGFDQRYATMMLGRGGDLYRLALTPIAKEMAILRKISSK